MDTRLKYTIKKLEDNGQTDCSECGHRPDYIEWMAHITEAAEEYRKNQCEETKNKLFDSLLWEPDFD